MAAILISVKNNLFTITLDTWDWSGLNVNGTDIQKGADGCYTYTQMSSGLVDFIAKANYGTVVNPDGNHFVMSGSTQSHIASLTYSSEGQPYELQGLLANVAPRKSAKSGPFPFSQGGMTGTFQHG